ncbi:MAG: hypothetical protein HOH77_00420 [Candidatus Latescibacteria bacterium]|nr:hypothetical protein [Candidatus Latescibacterota bacterium]
MVFVNEQTLFSFVGIQVSLKPDIVRDVFIQRLNFVLIENGISPDRVLTICEEYQHLTFGKTNSRSILGAMNDLVNLYDTRIYYDGGLAHCDMGALTYKMNRMPQKNLEWRFSIDALMALLG